MKFIILLIELLRDEGLTQVCITLCNKHVSVNQFRAVERMLPKAERSKQQEIEPR